MAACHVDPAKEPLIREFRDHHAPDWSSPQPPSVVLRSGAPLLIAEVTDEVLQASARDRITCGWSARSACAAWSPFR